ncbi:MAG: aminotransferase class IV, partial [Candidatus Altiarchaeota archaeon]
VFKLDEHLKRLEYSARTVGIKADDNKIKEVLKGLLAKNKLEDAYIRIMLTYGIGKPRLALDGGETPALIAVAEKLPKNLGDRQRKGVRVGFSKVKHYSKNPLNKIKTTNYLQTALRKKEALKRGLDDVIVLNEKGNVVEASTSNIFMVDKNKTLITPKTEDGCLPGITRKTIIEIARRLGIRIVERSIKPNKLLKAKEAFITNSMLEIVPVARIEKTEILKGGLTRRIRKEYRRLTGEG